MKINESASKMSLANVKRGIAAKPYRVLVYGVPGVGKTTFGSCAPKPIFLCSEDGIVGIDVPRFDSPRRWSEVLEAIRLLTYEDHDYSTLVIDSLDWLEPLCWAQVCAAAGKTSIEEFGYGKGYTAALDLWRQFAERLEVLERTRRMNIVLLAHATVKRSEDPLHGPFDRYRMKLHEKTADLFSEWVDALLFARHELAVINRKGSKAKAQSSGARILHTEWSPAFEAKNRYSLPIEIPLDWDEFEVAAAQHRNPEKLLKELKDLEAQLPQESRDRFPALLEWAGNDPMKLSRALDRVKGKIRVNNEEEG